MRKLNLILSLVFTVFLSFPSYADEWTEWHEYKGNTYYVDFERIRKKDGHAYYWELVDKIKPDFLGELSSISLLEVDCKDKKSRTVAATYYTQPMGRGNPVRTDNRTKQWFYPRPGAELNHLLKFVCKTKP